jgi:predicted phosphohydrolase
MKFRVLSDIHSDYYQGLWLEKEQTHQPNVDKLIEKLNAMYPVIEDDEILLLGGDLGIVMTPQKKISETYVSILKYLRSKWKSIIMIPGNHEYYYAKHIKIVDAILRKLCEELDIYFLQKDILEFKGFTFVGCVLWSDLSYNDWIKFNPKMRMLFNNYKAYKQQYHDNLSWLTMTLKNLRARDKVIVMTHYPPIPDLIHPKLLNSSRIRVTALTNDLSSQILKHELCPAYWICGHSHEKMKVEKFGIQFYLNPLGRYFEDRDCPASTELLIL